MLFCLIINHLMLHLLYYLPFPSLAIASTVFSSLLIAHCHVSSCEQPWKTQQHPGFHSALNGGGAESIDS